MVGKPSIELKYVGAGFVPGIPARDLTAEEVKEFGGEKFLLETGLYNKPDEKKSNIVKEEVE